MSETELAALLTEALATVVYPGLAAVSLFWVHVGVARLVRSRQMTDVLLLLAAAFATATFVLLALSTGLFVLFDFLQLRLAIRLGWLAVLVVTLLLSVDYARRQYANYQGRR
jgi:hypothetical protein